MGAQDKSNDKGTKTLAGNWEMNHANEQNALDTIHHTSVEWNLSKLGQDQHAERIAQTTQQQVKVDWRQELTTASAEMRQLQTMDPNSAEGRKLVADIDQRFLSALPVIKNDATSADSGMLAGIAQAENVGNDIQSLMSNPQIKEALGKQQAGQQFNPQTLTTDDIYNAALNTQDAGLQQQLKQLSSLAEMQNVAQQNVADNYWTRKAPMIASCEYADFLLKYKGGVTQTADGHVIQAADILKAVRNAEMIASPAGQQVEQRAADAASASQGQVVPPEQNPIAVLQNGMRNAHTPQDTLAAAQQAYALAQGPNFDPKNLEQQINQAKSDTSPAGQQKLAALQAFTHARAYTEGMLGAVMLQQPQPDYAKALEHLANAAKDPTAAESITDSRGKPILDSLIRQAMTGEQPNMQQTAMAFAGSMQDVAKHGQNYQQLDKEGKHDEAKAELNAAITSAENAVKYGTSIRQALGPNAGKFDDEYNAIMKKPENQRTPEEQALAKQLAPFVAASHYQAQAMYTLSQFDMAKGDHNAALKQLDDLAKVDPKMLEDPQFKAQYDTAHEAAKKAADYDNEGWFSKRWDDLKSAAGDVWDWIKDHGKIVGAAVGFAVGCAVAATGIGAPAGVAIAAVAGGILAGGVAGTTVGAGLEVASGQKKNFWDAAVDVAPAAFAGSATGALLVGAAPVAGGSGGLFGSGSMELPGVSATYNALGAGRMGLFAANGLRAGMIFAPYSAYRTYDNVQTGRDKTFMDAALDFGGSELQMAGTGGLFGATSVGGSAGGGFVSKLFNANTGAFFGGSVAKNAIAEGINPNGHDSFGGYVRNVGADTLGDVSARMFGPVFNMGGKINPGFGQATRSFYQNAFPMIASEERGRIHNDAVRLGVGLGVTPSVNDIADVTGKTPDEVRQILAAEQAQQQQFQQQPASGTTDGGAAQTAPTDQNSNTPAYDSNNPDYSQYINNGG